MEQYKSYKFRIYPTKTQKEIFAQTFGCARKIFNLLINHSKNYSINQMKMDFPYLNDVDPASLNFAQADFYRAIKAKKKPHYRTKGARKQSYSTKFQNQPVKVQHNTIHLPTLVEPLVAKTHRVPKGPIIKATISKHASGRYYISLLCKEEIMPKPKTNTAIGIDLGVSTFAAFSTGQKIDNQRFTKRMEQKLAREQRKLAKRRFLAKEKGLNLYEAKNYQKQKRRVAKLYEAVANRRKYFLDKLSTEIINNHDVICVESLSTKELLRNHKLAKSISDVSWSQFIQNLEYKARWYQKRLIVVNRWFPSSQICSYCGVKDTKRPLSVREWQCLHCYRQLDRDINASRNILFQGLRQANLRTVDRTGIAR